MEENEHAAGTSKGNDAELRDSLAQLEQLLANPDCPDRDQVSLMRDEISQLLGLEDSSKGSCSSGSSSSSESSEEGPESFLITQFLGHRCRAPYLGIRGISYHSAVVSEVLPVPKDTAFEDLQVKVMFLNPLNKAMETCKYYLNSTCSLGEACRFSHGMVVRFGDLLDYEEPDFESVDEGTVCLVRESGKDLWQLANVVSVSRDEGQVAVRLSETGAEIAVDFVNLLPLPMNVRNAEEQVSDDSDEVGMPCMGKATSSAPSGGFIGDWEKHTRGIGTKLMEKMGFVRGQGLGRESAGRAEPVQVNVLPKVLSLARFRGPTFRKGKSLDVCFASKDKVNQLNRLKRAKRKERKREEKLKSDYDLACKKDVFAFLNSTLNLQSSDRKRRADTVDIRNSTNRDLNIKILKVEQEIKQINDRILKLHRSSDRNRLRDPTNTDGFGTQIAQERNKLIVLDNDLKRLKNELSDRREMFKLKKF